jgi:hypothetical protein
MKLFHNIEPYNFIGGGGGGGVCVGGGGPHVFKPASQTLTWSVSFRRTLLIIAR